MDVSGRDGWRTPTYADEYEEERASRRRMMGPSIAGNGHQADQWFDSRDVEDAMSTSGKVTIERDGKTYGATYTVEGDMVHVKTHTETRSVALGGKKPEEIARRELEEIVEASRRR